MGKGQVYEMQYLSDEEKALINAKRSGATVKVNVFIHNIENIDTAIDKVNEFGPVKKFTDYPDYVTVTNWDIYTGPDLAVYVVLKKE